MDYLQENNEIEQVRRAIDQEEMKAVETVEHMDDTHSAAETALEEHDITTEHHLYARRYASEAAARETIGPDAVDLDEVSKEQSLGFKGDNYPTYDVSSNTEVASVKTHWSVDGKLNESALNAYKRDFGGMLGWGRNPGALEEDGRNILSVRDAGAPVPSELRSVSHIEAAHYLRDDSCLRIPDDHVNDVRDVLEQDIRTFPNNYHLHDYPSDEEVNEVLGRVQGLGMTSQELRSIIDRRMRH